MFVWHQSERVHIIWAGVWLTLGSLGCLTVLAIMAPHDEYLLAVPVILSLAGPLLTLIGTLIRGQPRPPDGAPGPPKTIVVP